MAYLFSVATVDDIPKLLDACELAATKYDQFKLFDFNAVIFSSTLKFLITQRTSRVIIEKSEAGDITGVICLILAPHYYSSAVLATKLFWFASTKKSAVKLLHLAKRWAKSQGATKLALALPFSGGELGTMQAVEQTFIEDLT